VTNQLKSYLKENEVGTVGDRQVTWKQITKTSFDSKRLKAEKPEIYGNYVVESQYRRLSVA
jgi:predicted phage-related endonuclease